MAIILCRNLATKFSTHLLPSLGSFQKYGHQGSAERFNLSLFWVGRGTTEEERWVDFLSMFGTNLWLFYRDLRQDETSAFITRFDEINQTWFTQMSVSCSTAIWVSFWQILRAENGEICISCYSSLKQLSLSLSLYPHPRFSISIYKLSVRNFLRDLVVAWSICFKSKQAYWLTSTCWFL